MGRFFARRLGHGLGALLVFWALWSQTRAQAPAQPPVYTYSVVKAYPHDKEAFTQGLEVVNGVFYEGTGLVGHSSIRKVKLETGAVLQRRDLPAPHFGEGITVFGGQMFQITWKSGLALVYDAATFRELKSFKYRGEGWGLTHDQTHLIMSDGSDVLRVLDPATFGEVRHVHVSDAGQPLRNINELEYMKGEVLANVWTTDYIARIDPTSGRVSGYIDLTGLMPAGTVSPDAVLNGIAYDDTGDRLFVTGKLWPRVYEIKIGPRK
ncbi:MAG: glutaminyl-peptide cyclotransferase [Vicinamibacterales bacterium]